MKGHLAEDMVLALTRAFEGRAPAALAIINDVVRRSPFTEPALGMGRSIAGYFAPKLTAEEHRVVLGALEEVSRVCGPTARFGNRQLNLVISQWRGLAPEQERLT